MGQFILDDVSIGEGQIDANNSLTNAKLPILKNQIQYNRQNSQNNNNNNNINNYQVQRDLKSYLIKKCSKMSQKITTRIYEENEQVEILSCTYNNQSYEVQILPVIIDFQLSIALHFHQTENVQSLTYDKKTTKAQIDRSHFNFSMPANNTNVGGYGTPVNVKRESFSRAAAVNMKRINFNGLPMLQNLSNQNTPVLNPQMHSTNNFQFIGDEKEEEILQIISFYQGMIKLFNSGVDDLIATLEYTCSQMQMKLIQLQIQGLKHLKQEQKLLFDALCLKATFFKNQYSSPNAMISNGIYGNQQTGLSNPPVQYHYFEFSEIQAAIKHHLFIHGYDYYFNVKAVMPQQYQIFSNKEAIQSMIQSCIYLIVELTKLKSMHQQQQNLMRTFSNSGAPIPQSTIQQNVNNIINGLNNPLTSTNTQTMQFSHHTHKMINIEFTQIISTNAASNINVKISNIQHPNLLDQQKHSKLSSFFFNVLRTYLDKVGIPASLLYKQNNDNLRYQLTFTLLSDCNSLQIQQQQLTSQYLIQANMATNRQTLAVAENNNNNNNTLSVYNNSNNVNISSNNNAISLKDKTLNNPINSSRKNTSSSNNNNNNNGEVDQGELANQDKDKEQGLNNKVPSVNLFVKIKNQNNNNVVIEEQANGYDEPNSNNEQFDLNLYNNIDVEELEEESDRLEVDNEYQHDDYKLNKQEKTGIGSGALFLVDSSIQTANKLDANHQTKNQTLFSKTAFGPKRNLSLQYN